MACEVSSGNAIGSPVHLVPPDDNFAGTARAVIAGTGVSRLSGKGWLMPVTSSGLSSAAQSYRAVRVGTESCGLGFGECSVRAGPRRLCRGQGTENPNAGGTSREIGSPPATASGTLARVAGSAAIDALAAVTTTCP